MSESLPPRVTELSAGICHWSAKNYLAEMTVATALDAIASRIYQEQTGKSPSDVFQLFFDNSEQGEADRASFNRLRAQLAAGYWENEQDAIGRRLDLRRVQFDLEDELGGELATQPPEFVRRLLGVPPGRSSQPPQLYDRRGLAELNRQYFRMTPPQLWERAAGALAGYVYGRGVVVDPRSPATKVLTAPAPVSEWPAGHEWAMSPSEVHRSEVQALVTLAAHDLGRDLGGTEGLRLVR